MAVPSIAFSATLPVNPSVTIGLAITRKFPWKAVPAYIAAQFVGALLASLSLWAVFGSKGRDAPILLGGTAPGTGFSTGAVFDISGGRATY